MNRYVIFLVTICSSLEIIKHKFYATAHHCTISSPASLHTRSFQSPVSSRALSHWDLPSLLQLWTCCAGVKNSLVSTLVSSIFSYLMYYWTASLSPLLLTTSCYPVESNWHPNGTGPPKPSIEFVYQSDSQVQHWQIVITTFLPGNNVPHTPWILSKKNLEISQRMDH